MVEDRQMTDDELNKTLAGGDAPEMPEEMAKRLDAATNELAEYKKRSAGFKTEMFKEREARQSLESEVNAYRAAQQTRPQYQAPQAAPELPPEVDPAQAAYFDGVLQNFGRNLLGTLTQAYEADQQFRSKRFDELEWRTNTPDYAQKVGAFTKRLSTTPEGLKALEALKRNPKELYALANSLGASTPTPTSTPTAPVPYAESGTGGTPPEPGAGRIIPFMPGGQTGQAPQSAASEAVKSTAMALYQQGKITKEQLLRQVPDLNDGDVL